MYVCMYMCVIGETWHTHIHTNKRMWANCRESSNRLSECLAGESVEIADREIVVNPELQAALAMSKR